MHMVWFTSLFPGNYLKQKYIFRRGLCQDTYPSCKNKPDGINENPIRRPAPYFIICLQERLIGGGVCEFDSFWGVRTFPFNNTCVQAYAIPKAEYSLVDSHLVMEQQVATGTMTVRVMCTTGAITV